MIDVHSHVLPAIDDGPDDTDGSVALARASAQDGVQTLVATPHLRADHPRVDVHEIASQCHALASALPPDLPIDIVPGGEIDILWALEVPDEELRLASIGQNGRYLLIETPHRALDSGFETLLFRVAARGFDIVLAHPEVNVTLQGDPGRLIRLAGQVAALQITARSLLAPRHFRSRELAEALLREGMVHFVASDCHSAGPWRPPELSEGIAAARQVAPQYMDAIVTDAPAALLAGADLPALPAPPRRGRLRDWLSRRRGQPLAS